MRRQRGRMEEKEAQWVRGYIKAQRAWKARTGFSIDEFHIPGSTAHRVTKSLGTGKKRLRKVGTRHQEEAGVSLLAEVTRLETILLLAAIVCVSLSVGVHFFGPISRN
ncbi:hypothetical protein PHMEG_00030142 [Phytophthora megakarya]|uniref:Uncharacterized protein n=1 Tax=Phytophthora megakarya TaxID=4795 RepID=A0A225V1C1_9STRA|nr:hypothetical protein PHMEG_00030142 [Phytophthora megakarya]